jgi:DNA-binding transcriptional ArsR family regulator
MRMSVFELLAEPVRLRIVEVLATGEHTAGELAEVITTEFEVGRTAVSNHLRHLLDSRFAVVRTEGPTRVYRLDPGAMDRLDLAVDRLRELWEARYGWPYLNDSWAQAQMASRRRSRGRGMRGRREEWLDGGSTPSEADTLERPVSPQPRPAAIPEVQARTDPWQYVRD